MLDFYFFNFILADFYFTFSLHIRALNYHTSSLLFFNLYITGSSQDSSKNIIEENMDLENLPLTPRV